MKYRNSLSKKRVSRKWLRDFLGGPVVKNPPANAGDAGSNPGWGAGIPHAVGHLSLHATTREQPPLSKTREKPAPQPRPSTAKE